MDILVVASTVPAHAHDHVPRFVLDQAVSLAEADPDVRIRILAPHAPSSRALEWPRPESADGRVMHHRFGYAPRRLETLTAGGIMPAIRANPALIAVIPLLFWGERRALRREIRRQRPDVIYAHWFTPQAIVSFGVAKRTGVPFGFTTHAADVAVLRKLGPLGTRIVRAVTRRARFVTAVSRQTAERLLAFFEPAERDRLEQAMAIIPMGIHRADALAKSGNSLTVLVVARLVEKKGIHVLLDAWPAVRAAVSGARLIIGGDGPWRERLEAQAQHLEGVEFVGFVTGEAKATIENRAAIIAVPSVVASDGDVDGLPVAALEGLARGAYVIASNASGAQELLQATTAGSVVPAGDVEALSTAIITAMTRDEQTRERDSAAARALAKNVEWSALAPATLTELRRSEPLPLQGSGS